MDAILPKTSLFECGPEAIASEEDMAHTFGYEFQLKGNFTFTWLLAVN